MTPGVEKPYDFVPFLPEVKRERPEGHFRFAQLTGTLELELVAHRPVQVASGFLDVVSDHEGDIVAAQPTWGCGGAYVIPGSSLKGVIRSLVEAISPSCVRVAGGRSRRAIPQALSPCVKVKDLCPACRLFGMSGRRKENYAGQVQVEDAVMVSGQIVLVRTPILRAPARSRRGLPERYMAGNEAIGRKFYSHGTMARGTDARIVAGSGAVFEARLHFENLREAELGLLLAALGQHPQYPFLIKVGAGKPVGMGSLEVRVRWVALSGDLRRSGRAGRGGERLEGEPLAQAVVKWVETAAKSRLLDLGALERLYGILQQGNLSRPSPEGPY